MKKLNKVLALSALSLIGLVSCKHDNFEDFIGPRQCPENFAYSTAFSVSSTNQDLTVAPVDITAGFNQEVEWTLTITGQTSGAIKSYSGTSDTVGVTWYGRPNKLPWFDNETVTVELSIKCIDTKQTSNVTIQKNNFANFGILGDDFDGNGSLTGWYNYGGAKVGLNQIVSDATAPGASPQGGNFWKLEGNSTVVEWFFGGAGASIPSMAGMGTDPDQCYFNVFINGNGEPASEAQIVLREGGTLKLYRQHIDWTGWKMVSIPVSEFKNTGSGEAVMNPQNLNLFEMSLGSFPEQAMTAEVNFDFVIFTAGEPFFTE